MRLLIDGYNLLHATDLFGAGELAGTLRGSREALIGFLAERLTEGERRSTVIVFDAADAPSGLPDRYDYAGIDLRFARDYPDADSMIEAILEEFRRAKHLTVVSGDRRVQRAARSSGAKWIDSGPWFAELCRRQPKGSDAPAKPAGQLGSNADWVAEFDDPDALEAIEREAAEAPLPKPPPAPPPPSKSAAGKDRPAPAKKAKKRKRRPPLDEPIEKPRRAFGAGLSDVFPPGYGEDLLSKNEHEDRPDDE